MAPTYRYLFKFKISLKFNSCWHADHQRQLHRTSHIRGRGWESIGRRQQLWKQTEACHKQLSNQTLHTNQPTKTGLMDTCLGTRTSYRGEKVKSTTCLKASRRKWLIWFDLTPPFFMIMQGVTLLLSRTSDATGNGRFWNIRRTHPIWVHAITISSPKWKNYCEVPGTTQEMNLSVL